MPRIRRADNKELIGSVTEAQLKSFVDLLEDESPDDRDYYLTPDTLDMLAEDGCDPAVIALLRGALGAAEELDVEVEWEAQEG